MKYYYYKDGSILDHFEPTKILHREDGPAVTWYQVDWLLAWYVNGKCHREDGPAIIYANGDKEWYIDNNLHREDGPAKELANGNKEWYLHGRGYLEEQYIALGYPKMKRADYNVTEAPKCTCDFNTLMRDGCKCGAFKAEQKLKAS